MKFNKKLIALLAIFCVVISAGLVCAEDAAPSDNGDAGAETTVNGDTGADTADTGNDAGNAGTTDAPVQDATSNETANATIATSNETDTNTTGNATGNTTNNATGNATNSTSLPKAIQNFVTGNPILVLAFVIIVGAGTYFYKRE
ncbi:hypothetical protein [uncultured Methanobrevibacter sp.]|uniref:hypothetical protein n=1 Tax=uncultured Methanobrevibacter sp. TaxID=253161 RepID=UPI0025D442C9|nr:hypothetical protein [uncultured Methanobrevibacter sp.]